MKAALLEGLSERVVQIHFPATGEIERYNELTIGAAEFSGKNHAGLKVVPFKGVLVELKDHKSGAIMQFDLDTRSARAIGQRMLEMADAVESTE